MSAGNDGVVIVSIETSIFDEAFVITLQCRSEAPLVGGEILKSVWNFIAKNEFWFFCLIIMGLYVGEYQTGETWMASLAFVLFLIAGTRLASHPMWKKDEE